MTHDIQKVKSIISTYLEQEHVHDGFKLIEIVYETISTYDGTYPSIKLIYESSGNNLWLIGLRRQLISGIEKYTGLKHNTDFWLGVSHDNYYIKRTVNETNSANSPKIKKVLHR